MDKIALVTGASSGIGKACSMALLKEGWTVFMVARREDVLHVAAQESGTDRAIPLCADVTQPDQVQAAFAEIENRFGRLDLLFNNAGTSLPYNLPSDLPWDDWRRIVDVNLNASFYCLSRAFDLMKRQSPQGGRIINNGSISAHAPRPGSIAYTATKHAISGLTKAANLDGRALNIAVGQLDIGNVATDLTLKMTKGMRQADGTMRPEPRMDLSAVAQTFMAMVNLPLEANILTATVMASQMPYVGRG